MANLPNINRALELCARITDRAVRNARFLRFLRSVLPSIESEIELRDVHDSADGGCHDKIIAAGTRRVGSTALVAVAIETTSWSDARGGGGIGKRLHVVCFMRAADATTRHTSEIVETQPRIGGYRTEYTRLAKATLLRVVVHKGSPIAIKFFQNGEQLGSLRVMRAPGPDFAPG